MTDGFWLFEGLEEEPYGLLPLVNLSGKGGPTSTKYVDRIGSYQWYLQDDTPTILQEHSPGIMNVLEKGISSLLSFPSIAAIPTEMLLKGGKYDMLPM
ncbi:hypothetical protein ANCDUO_16326 [Ancylostoma duodenale]|uniref:Uncharacterized protein n=1 Tax=Ancylostoma duodenale TaxID=51022 RepID=A0A0C2G967_9BILA|nr:hypothetical protein ANCDUO_16326 [Ancylostoma duodenale]